MTRYYGSASRYLGPYSYYLLLSIDLPRLLLPRVILVTDFRRQSPFVIDRSLCPWGTSSSPDIDTRPLSIFIYSLLLRIKVLCTPLYFLSSNIDLIYLSHSGLGFRLSSTSPSSSSLRLRCGIRP